MIFDKLVLMYYKVIQLPEKAYRWIADEMLMLRNRQSTRFQHHAYYTVLYVICLAARHATVGSSCSYLCHTDNLAQTYFHRTHLHKHFTIIVVGILNTILDGKLIKSVVEKRVWGYFNWPILKLNSCTIN